jgi:hypothetical protein
MTNPEPTRRGREAAFLNSVRDPSHTGFLERLSTYMAYAFTSIKVLFLLYFYNQFIRFNTFSQKFDFDKGKL